MDALISSRDHHLFGEGPKRILALDGGGVRGILTIAYLEQLEALLCQHAGKPVRLCDWFDLIGGTSTGAIIAALLSIGKSAGEIKAFYLQLAPSIFKRPLWRLPGWSSKFDSEKLRTHLDTVLHDMRLGSNDILTGLCIISKRLDTGGAWILMNNPRSKFWNIGNAELHLTKIVRASTAAPHFFDPEIIDHIDGQKPGLFLDGGLTPHNNPSLALFLAAVLPPIGLRWQVGRDNLLIVSIGTGTFRPKVTIDQAKRARALGLAVRALTAQIAESQRLIMMLMSWMGEAALPWILDSEIGDAGEIPPPFAPLFQFARYDVSLEQEWLAKELGVEISPEAIEKLRLMDDPSNLNQLYDLGKKAASIQLAAQHIAAWSTFSRGPRI